MPERMPTKVWGKKIRNFHLSSILHRYIHRFSLFKFLAIRFDWIRKQSYRESLSYCVLTIRGQVPDKPQQSCYLYPLCHSIQNIEKSERLVQSANASMYRDRKKPWGCKISWLLKQIHNLSSLVKKLFIFSKHIDFTFFKSCARFFTVVFYQMKFAVSQQKLS